MNSPRENQGTPYRNDYLIGFNDEGEAFTEENMPWYRGKDSKIIFKKKNQIVPAKETEEKQDS